MFGTYFYHEKTRKAVALFGRLFNNIYVLRQNAAGAVISTIKLPLAYAPKEKYIERIRQNPDLATDENVAIKLPRASFEISGITYDTTRQLTKLSNFSQPGSAVTKRTKMYSPVPYTIQFTFNVYAKSHDDALQVDRKSTRLNSSHRCISYAVFCLKKKIPPPCWFNVKVFVVVPVTAAEVKLLLYAVSQVVWFVLVGSE